MTIDKKKNAFLWLSLGLMFGAFCLQYAQDFKNLLIRWDTEDFSYCYLVPFIFAYLVYTNRQVLSGADVRSSEMGFPVMVLAGLLYLGGRLGSVETLIYASIWFSIVAMALLFAGYDMVKKLAFPFLILAFIVPLPSFLNSLFTFQLKLISSALSVQMMQVAGLSVYREGNIIDLGVSQLQVVDACSGLRYVYPLVLMGLVFAYLFHKRWWERIVVIVATVPISVVSNAVRIAITGYLTLKVSPEAAEGFFHGFSGWLIFMVSFAFLAVVSWSLKILGVKLLGREKKWDSVRRVDLPLSVERVRSVYCLVGAGLFVAVWAVTLVFAAANVVPQRASFEFFPLELGDWEGKKSYIDEKLVQESLWADDYVQVLFKNRQTNDVLLLFVPYYTYQGTRHTVHSPVACIVGGGGFAPRATHMLERQFPQPFGDVQIKQIVFEKTDQFLLSNYWFQQRGRVISDEYWNKWFMFWDSITKRRTDGALVRVEMALARDQDIEQAQAVMDAFTAELMKVLPEYVPN